MGQALFNAFYLVWPKFADSIRTTDADPFYDDKQIKVAWKKFYEYCKTAS
jgi:hypothetical protein